jgi:hypothetical protein
MRRAEGRWLAADAQGNQLVRPGSVIAITEGPKLVAYFTVQPVQTPDPVSATHSLGAIRSVSGMTGWFLGAHTGG